MVVLVALIVLANGKAILTDMLGTILNLLLLAMVLLGAALGSIGAFAAELWANRTFGDGHLSEGVKLAFLMVGVMAGFVVSAVTLGPLAALLAIRDSTAAAARASALMEERVAKLVAVLEAREAREQQAQQAGAHHPQAGPYYPQQGGAHHPHSPQGGW